MKKLILLIILFLLVLSCGPKNYLNESQNEIESRMEWWKDAKFGMFIHWGVYSVPAGWYKGEMVPGISEWIMYSANIPVEEYEEFAAEFNPVEYDPDKWVRIAKQAGMKYVVITSKHHDGFCIWDSKITDYDIADFTQYKKDLLKPLAEACKREGIALGFYHSIMDWHHPDATGENFAKYRDQYMIPQLEELLSEFENLSILWFDGEWIDEWTEEQGKDLYNHLRNIKPDLIINNRVGKGRQGMQGMNKDVNSAGDFGTPEQEILETSSDFPWESCMTMNDSWGFKKGDDNWKSSEALIYNIIDITSKGGNYLLNVGPDSKGNIPEESIERLEKIGKWMKVNGEGIYSTRPIKNYFEGENIRYTVSKDSEFLYAFIINPSDKIELKYITPIENSKIVLLQNGEMLKYEINSKSTIIEIPDNVKEDDFPICLKIKGKENDVAAKPLISVNKEEIKNTYLFQRNVKVELISPDENSEIFFSYDGSIPTLNSIKYTSDLILENSAELSAVALKNGYVDSPVNTVKFYKIENVQKIELKNDPSDKYSGKGKLGLVDGKRGSLNYSDKSWLGFEGTDFEAVLDLGSRKNIERVTLGCLSNINSWVFLPQKVSFYTSENNLEFKKVDDFLYEFLKSEKQGAFRKDISAKVNDKVRYVKIIAENIGVCPEWHKGSGEKAWLFVDEIIID